MPFSLIKLPMRVLYVDDKASFLEALRMAMPKSHARQFISSPIGAVDRLSYEMSHWRCLESMLDGSRYAADDSGVLLKWLVENYFRNPFRFGLSSILIADYSMPGLNGVDLIRRLGSWPGRKLLLTGEADARVAIDAFNDGLIQKFIPKDTNQLYRVLKVSCDDLHAQVCEHIGHLLRPNLTTEQKDVLQDERVVESINTKIEDLDWIEYVVVGRPFGLIGMARNGPLQWLQLETKRTLSEIVELAAEIGLSRTDIEMIEKGCAIPSHEIRAALSLPVSPVLLPAECIMESPELYCAVYDLPVPSLNSGEMGSDDILSPIEEIKSLLRSVIAYLDFSVLHVSAETTISEPRTDSSKIIDTTALSHASVNRLDTTVIKYAIGYIGALARQSDEYRKLLFIDIDDGRLTRQQKSLLEELLASAGITRS